MASSPTPPALNLDTLAEQLTAQLLLERDMLLAWVDERERMLNIRPRTAEVRKWYRERNGKSNEPEPTSSRVLTP